MKIQTLLFLALAACSAPPDFYYVHLAPSLHEGVAWQALLDWQKETRVHFDATLTTDGCNVQDCIFIDERVNVSFDGDLVLSSTCKSGGGRRAAACTLVSEDGSNVAHINVRPDLPEKEYLRVYHHELGHALGLPCKPEWVHTAMATYVEDQSLNVTGADMRLYEYYRGRKLTSTEATAP